ncbi:MAG TPA: caspase family protein, partial [Geminicoccaceae bacterium]|nr:caspase family protein [Geminicoccaceae bacterium]
MTGSTASPATPLLPARAAAVLVGVADYEQAPLIGPKNDISVVYDALRKRGTSWSITRLVDRAASSAGVREAIDSALSTLEADDLFLLYFSG